ncbi:UNKNOWN [Stylonychia lemnae]|uniref:Uncharacterized protein n=1 Tax=Stylonychia lemnae TaxID=5949 RepID=A0A078A9F0_STYLE|nr:UNKNOWN [Stylonychia lemnae]|eukprot:CDW78880.1 UNKNOWN [Stylonychia lemnae]
MGITNFKTNAKSVENSQLFKTLLEKEENAKFKQSYLSSNAASFKFAYQAYKQQKQKPLVEMISDKATFDSRTNNIINFNANPIQKDVIPSINITVNTHKSSSLSQKNTWLKHKKQVVKDELLMSQLNDRESQEHLMNQNDKDTISEKSPMSTEKIQYVTQPQRRLVRVIKKNISGSSENNQSQGGLKPAKAVRQLSPSKDLSPALSANRKDKTKTLINEILVNQNLMNQQQDKARFGSKNLFLRTASQKDLTQVQIPKQQSAQNLQSAVKQANLLAIKQKILPHLDAKHSENNPLTIQQHNNHHSRRIPLTDKESSSQQFQVGVSNQIATQGHNQIQQEEAQSKFNQLMNFSLDQQFSKIRTKLRAYQRKKKNLQKTINYIKNNHDGDDSIVITKSIGQKGVRFALDNDQ